jgi:hypothetical protein
LSHSTAVSQEGIFPETRTSARCGVAFIVVRLRMPRSRSFHSGDRTFFYHQVESLFLL